MNVTIDPKLKTKCPRTALGCVTARVEAGISPAALLEEIIGKLTPGNHPVAVGLANIPEKIRGFGHVKARHLMAAKADEAALLEQFRSGQPTVLKAAE